MKEIIVGKNKHMLKQTKYCKGCGQTKARSEFSLKDKEKGYLRSRCKECCSLASKEYKLKNKEKVKETLKRSYQKNREKRLAYQKEYYIKKSIKEVKELLNDRLENHAQTYDESNNKTRG